MLLPPLVHHTEAGGAIFPAPMTKRVSEMSLVLDSEAESLAYRMDVGRFIRSNR